MEVEQGMSKRIPRMRTVPRAVPARSGDIGASLRCPDVRDRPICCFVLCYHVPSQCGKFSTGYLLAIRRAPDWLYRIPVLGSFITYNAQ